MTTLKEEWALYTEKASRTMGKHLSKEERIENCIMGLSGEIGEIAETFKNYDFDKMVFEFGDLFWYISQLAKAISSKMVNADNPNYLHRNYPVTCILDLTIHISKIMDHLKKHKWHGDWLDYHLIDDHLYITFSLAMAFVSGVMILNPVNVWESNIQKLEKRWPGKFGEKNEQLN